MENIIRGTTPSLVIDFADITDFVVADIDEIALTVKSRTQTNIYHLENVEISGNTGYWLGGVTYNWFAW
jgi:hypothetical protein